MSVARANITPCCICTSRISRHLLAYTPLLDATTRTQLLALPHGPELFSGLDPEPSRPDSFKLSQLGLLLSGEIKLSVPVYTVYGPVEDVRVLEKFRTGEYEVDNLMVLDEALTRSLEVGGIKLRLFGLGGGVQMHKMCELGMALCHVVAIELICKSLWIVQLTTVKALLQSPAEVVRSGRLHCRSVNWLTPQSESV
jgi:hypothetical protein